MRKLLNNNPNTPDFWVQQAETGYLENYCNQPLPDSYVEAFNSQIDNRDSVLDAGAGSGTLTKRLKGRVIACDFSPLSVKWLKQLGIPAEEVDLSSKIPYPDKSVDVIVCTEVLEHVTDPKKTIGELARVARKKIIISVPYDNGRPQSEEHVWLFENIDLKNLLKSHGDVSINLDVPTQRWIAVCNIS